jgi:hypothetical protein
MDRQRALLMGAVSIERARAMAAVADLVAVEGAQVLDSVESQRLATLKWATLERRETIAEVRRELAAAVSAVRAVVINDVRGIVDGVLLRVALFLIAGVVLAPLVARVWPRRR